MKRLVRYSARADDDALAIRDWIAKKSVTGAIRWLDALEAATLKLQDSADQCPRAGEADALAIDLRELLFRTRHGRNYRILFVIHDNIVHLAAIRGAGQDLVSNEDLELPG